MMVNVNRRVALSEILGRAMVMRKTLVVGINNYPSTPLTGCINDAEAVENILKRHGDGNVNFAFLKKLNIKNKGDLKGIIQDCFAGDGDVALFYFSGHGLFDAFGGYIVTPDYKQNDWGVSMQEILEIVNRSKFRNRVVILDCCYSGVMGNISTTGQSTAVIQEGVTILAASRYNEFAREEKGHGIFTALLIDALKGGAADVTGHVTPGGIYAYVDKSLNEWDQRPAFKTNVTRFSPLRIVKPQIDISIIRKLVDYWSSPRLNRTPCPSEEVGLEICPDLVLRSFPRSRW